MNFSLDLLDVGILDCDGQAQSFIAIGSIDDVGHIRGTGLLEDNICWHAVADHLGKFSDCKCLFWFGCIHLNYSLFNFIGFIFGVGDIEVNFHFINCSTNFGLCG